MNGIVDTPFRLTPQEVLCSAASTLCLQALSDAGMSSRRLDEVCDAPQYGYTAAASHLRSGPRFVRITDIKGGTIDWASVPFCDCPDPAPYELQAGDILVARSGSVGKSLQIREVPESAVFASYMIRIRAKSGVLPSFVYWCLQSQQFWQQISALRRGSAIKNINGRMLAELRFPIPPLPLQSAMGDFLEGFRRKLGGASAALPLLPRPLSVVPRCVLKIEELAARIHKARALREDAAEEALVLVPAAVSTLDAKLRQATTLMRLESVASPEKGSLRSGPFGSALLHSEFVPEGIPAIGIQDVQENRFVLTRRWNVTAQKAEQLKRYAIKPHDILVTVMGTLGRACVVPKDVPLMISTKHVWTITLDRAKAEPQWVSYWINFAREVREELLGRGTGTAIAGLNSEKIRAVWLPNIPLVEQQRIAGDLDSLQAKVDALRCLQAQTAAELDALLPAILDRAFKGEL